MLQPDVTIGFSKASMLSPDGRCKSFDARANGYVRGEGAGVVILKPLQRALADGDRIYAAHPRDGGQSGRPHRRASLSRAKRRRKPTSSMRCGWPTYHAGERSSTSRRTGRERRWAIRSRRPRSGRSTARRERPRGALRDRLDQEQLRPSRSGGRHGRTDQGDAVLCSTAASPGNLHFENPNPQIPFDDLRLRVSQRLEPWPDTHRRPAARGRQLIRLRRHQRARHPGSAAGATHADAASGGGARRSRLDAAACRRAVPRALPDLARLLSRGARAGRKPGRRGAPRHLLLGAVKAIPSRPPPCARRARPCFARRSSSKRSVEWRGARQQLDRPQSSSCHRSPSSSARAWASNGGRWGASCSPQEPVFRRAVDEVSELLRGARRLVAHGEADGRRDTLAGAGDARTGSRRSSRCRSGWRRCGDRGASSPRPCLGHSAGEMAATYISGALSLEDAVRVTFHRSRLQYRTAGQGIMLAAGISRGGGDPAGRTPSTGDLDRRDQRLRARSRSRAMPPSSPRSRRRSMPPVASAARCRWTCPITARRWSSSNRNCSRPCAISGRGRPRRRSSRR